MDNFMYYFSSEGAKRKSIS